MRRPIGTDGYIAPEQCDPSRGLVGPPADVFGLAATLHHAVRASGLRARGAARFPQLERDGGVAAAAGAFGSGGAAERGARARSGGTAERREFAAGLEPLVAALPRRLCSGAPWLAAALTNVNPGWVGRLGKPAARLISCGV